MIASKYTFLNFWKSALICSCQMKSKYFIAFFFFSFVPPLKNKHSNTEGYRGEQF